MARTVVGVAANLCPVDAEGKNIHSSVSCRFAESIRQVGGLPLVIPVGDESVVRDYVEMIDKLILTGGQNVHPQFYGEKKTIESDDYNLVRDEFELALLKEALRQNKPNYGNLSRCPTRQCCLWRHPQSRNRRSLARTTFRDISFY
ncbi:putative glutamine amidotransferase [Streptococcus mitis]|uniref:Putative glutamine amidotransferase n=1 Tax=Streptococcus mitis TaxID=28037 RepID=A0A428HDM0_STRMT|nr:putative glutamine amidotransferase [Streptococcus mitis]